MPSSIDSTDNNSPTYQLPFALDENSFQKWIESINLNNEIESLETLSSTLTALNNVLMPPKTRYFFLHKIAILTDQLFHQTLSNYKNSFYPFSEIVTQKVELSTLCSIEIVKICAMFCNDRTIITNNTFTEQQLALIIYRGIYFQGQVIFLKSMLYRNVDQGFWHASFMFYLYAKQNNILELNLKNQTTNFINAFKHLLVFELCNPQCFNTDEIIAVFQLLKKFSTHVEIISKVPEKQLKNIPYIDLISDAPPSFSIDDNQVPTYHYYVSNLKVIKNLHQLSLKKTNPTDYTKTFLERMIETLRFSHQRSNDRNQVTDPIDIVTGFDKIIAFIQTIPKSIQSASNKKSLLFLQIDESNKPNIGSTDNIRSDRNAHTAFIKQEDDTSAPNENSNQIDSTDIWNAVLSEPEPQETRNKDISATVTIFDKSHSGFRLSIKDANVKTKVGEIIGLITANTLTITIVRRILQIDQNDSHLGVEYLGNNVDFLKLINPGSDSVAMGIYFISNDQSEHIIIKSSTLQNEAFLFSNNNDKIVKYKVENQVHLSPKLTMITVNSN